MINYYATPDRLLFVMDDGSFLFRFDWKTKTWVQDDELADIWIGERWVDDVTEEEVKSGIADRLSKLNPKPRPHNMRRWHRRW